MESLATFIVFGIVWGVACGATAPSRNRSRGAWAALGFFLGIVALIILVCMPRVETASKGDRTMIGIGPYSAGPRPLA